MILADLIKRAEVKELPIIELDKDDPLAALFAQVELPKEPNDIEIFSGKIKEINLPVAEMKDIKNIADDLDLAIIPFSALSSSSWKHEDKNMQKAINGFVKIASNSGLNVYALSPPIYFDMKQYVEMCDGAPCYGGGRAGAFSAIHLTTHMLKDFAVQINSNRESIKSLAEKQSKDFNTTRKAISNVEDRISKVENELDRRAEKAQKLKEAEWAAAEVNRQKIMEYRTDPLLIAIEGTDITRTKYAIAGPCWGPDIPNNVLSQIRRL